MIRTRFSCHPGQYVTRVLFDLISAQRITVAVLLKNPLPNPSSVFFSLGSSSLVLSSEVAMSSPANQITLSAREILFREPCGHIIHSFSPDSCVQATWLTWKGKHLNSDDHRSYFIQQLEWKKILVSIAILCSVWL